MLWPEPRSRYVRVRQAQDAQGNDRIAVGIAFCDDCCPSAGDACHPAVVEAVADAHSIHAVETAHERYRYWYSAQYGEWLQAHARDYLKLDEGAITALMAQWQKDVEA